MGRIREHFSKEHIRIPVQAANLCRYERPCLGFEYRRTMAFSCPVLSKLQSGPPMVLMEVSPESVARGLPQNWRNTLRGTEALRPSRSISLAIAPMYDSDGLDKDVQQDGVNMIALHRSTRTLQTQDGCPRYERRGLIECFFVWLQ